ncbi:MAG: Tad domain-containing protein, partial [Actinomycetota bacterium]
MRALSRRIRTLRESAEDSGVVMPVLALLLIILLGFAGFAVDVGNWYLTANKAQRAADAGALGGVALMPGDFDGAESTAEDLAEANGFEVSDVTVEPGARPNQLRVTIEDTVDNFFANLFGVEQTTITRTALAEFQGASIMGSPSNWLGNNADPSAPSPEMWLMNAAPGSQPPYGDRFQAELNSTEYDPDGYTYKVEVKNTPPGQPLRIQVFDPNQVDVGFTSCGRLPSNAENAQLAADHPGLYGVGGTYTPVDGDATFRYARGRWDRVNFP